MTQPALRWVPAYIGLGSNLASPRQQVRAAFSALRKIAGSRLVAVSPLYRSAPMGPPDQPDFVNAVAALVTQLPAADLLKAMQDIEREQGRRRDGPRWGPRTLDLDLLVYGQHKSDTAALKLPHPGISERNFVLFPLLDIAPHLTIPGLATVATLASKVAAESPSLERLDD